MNVLESSFGFLGLVLCTGSYAARSHKAMAWVCAAGIACWSMHFALKGAATASVLSMASALRIAASVWIVHWSAVGRKAATAAAFAVALGGAYLTWAGWLSVPSLAATLIASWAGMNLGLARLRIALLAVELLWVLNAWVLDSMLALTASLIGIGLNMWFIARTPTSNQAERPT